MPKAVTIDHTDYRMFCVLYDTRMTSVELTKKVFHPLNTYNLRALESFLRHRLKKWVSAGVITQEGENPVHYTVNKDQLLRGYGRLNLEQEEQMREVDVGPCIVVFGSDMVLIEALENLG